MQLLLIVDDYLPHSIKVAAKMMHELALEFKSQGHIVTVLTPKPAQKKQLVVENFEGINVLYFKSGQIKNTGKIKRAVNETLLSFFAWQACKSYFANHKFDQIIYYSPSIFWGPLVKKLKTKWACQSYLILRDIFPQWTVDNGLIKKHSLIHRYFSFFEKINYSAATTIGVMSPSNLFYFQQRFTDIEKFDILYNWAANEETPVANGKHRIELGLENKIVFFYGGNIGHAQKMIYLVDLAKEFKSDTKVHFLFVGKGDEVELILKEKEEHGLSNLTYLPPVDQNTYFEMLNEFDIGLFSLHPDHKTHNFPGKLLGYMSYSKPILGCVNPGNDLKEMVNDAKAGIIVDSGNKRDLIKAALRLAESNRLRNEMGNNGKKLLVEIFSVQNAYKQIINKL